MSDSHGMTEILFFEHQQVARIALPGGWATEPLHSHEEILRTIWGLKKDGLIEEHVSEILQANVWQVPIPQEGVREKLLSEGVHLVKMMVDEDERGVPEDEPSQIM